MQPAVERLAQIGPLPSSSAATAPELRDWKFCSAKCKHRLRMTRQKLWCGCSGQMIVSELLGRCFTWSRHLPAGQLKVLSMA